VTPQLQSANKRKSNCNTHREKQKKLELQLELYISTSSATWPKMTAHGKTWYATLVYNEEHIHWTVIVALPTCIRLHYEFLIYCSNALCSLTPYKKKLRQPVYSRELWYWWSLQYCGLSGKIRCPAQSYIYYEATDIEIIVDGHKNNVHNQNERQKTCGTNEQKRRYNM